MADPVRIRRIAEQIRAELSQILRDEVRDPRVGLVTVTRVKLARDLGMATIFFSPLGEDPDAERAEMIRAALDSASGFIRRGLAARVKLRKVPDLRFVLDDSIAEGSRTLELIRSLGEGDAAERLPERPVRSSGSGLGDDGRDDGR